MSVINQMLKDLDERQVEGENRPGNKSPTLPTKAAKKNSLVVIVLVLIFIVLLAILWRLYQPAQSVVDGSVANTTNIQDGKAVLASTTENQTLVKSEKQSDSADPVLSATKNENTVENAESTLHELSNPTQLTVVETVEPKQPLGKDRQTNQRVSQADAPERDLKRNETASTSETNVEQLDNKPSLTISRKALSPEEVVAQKLKQAEQAIELGDTKKAENLFEDVLLIDRYHSTARKQLAALWFGRQDYQSAHNLLSQGIALFPSNSDYRLMKARIYLKQGQTVRAVDTLASLEETDDVVYLSLLASSAQQIQRYQLALTSYRRLTEIENRDGRWWLGYAVALDSLGDFAQAVTSYKTALQQQNLSSNAQQFIRQRLTEIED